MRIAHKTLWVRGAKNNKKKQNKKKTKNKKNKQKKMAPSSLFTAIKR
jgi:hypothetical protein